MYFALRKCKNDSKILTIILVPDICPLKPEIARFSIGFRLKNQLWYHMSWDSVLLELVPPMGKKNSSHAHKRGSWYFGLAPRGLRLVFAASPLCQRAQIV